MRPNTCTLFRYTIPADAIRGLEARGAREKWMILDWDGIIGFSSFGGCNNWDFRCSDFVRGSPDVRCSIFGGFVGLNGGSIFDRVDRFLIDFRDSYFRSSVTFLLRFWHFYRPYRRFRLSRGFPTIYLENIYIFLSKLLNFRPHGSVLSRFFFFFEYLHRCSLDLYSDFR